MKTSIEELVISPWQAADLGEIFTLQRAAYVTEAQLTLR